MRKKNNKEVKCTDLRFWTHRIIEYSRYNHDNEEHCNNDCYVAAILSIFVCGR